ncbi:MAG: hydantoinase/oxoprolinase family protein [Methylophagaceae bacterium]
MTINNSYITGWDIGGAHLKVARCDRQGTLLHVEQFPCPLWQGIELLEQAIQAVHKKLNNQDDLAAITMTGELVDIFTDRQSGVTEILDCFNRYISEQNSFIYAGEVGWLSPKLAKQQWQHVASRNWQASASLAASKIDNALFVDIGSTTSDIIPIYQGQVIPSAYTDHQRQSSRELLYTGAIRTPLIALTNIAPFKGELVSLAAEVFATTGDCWILLDQIFPDNIQDNSADGQSWSKSDCARRLARLLGIDSIDASTEHWLNLAQWFSLQQIHQIMNACLQVLSGHSQLSHATPIVGAGIGRFIVQQCANQLNKPYIDFSSLVSPTSNEAADHAPAVAIALLAQQDLT